MDASTTTTATIPAGTATGADDAWSKVPEVTLVFWILKVLATTLGETGGDAVSMSMNLGYLVGTAIFAVVFVVAVGVQIAAKRFHPVVYWTTIIASTTVGTTLADFADRSLGTIAVDSVSSPKSELFYWVTIMFSQTLGTALGDWTADTAGLGYTGGALIFGGLLALVAAAYFWTRISHTVLFWTAFILTRPLGAVVGDFLDKPVAKGGLALSRYSASATLLVLMALGIFLLPHRPAKRAH